MASKAVFISSFGVFFAVMTKEGTFSYHRMSCAFMDLNSSVKQLRGPPGSNWNQFLRFVYLRTYDSFMELKNMKSLLILDLRKFCALPC